MTLLDLARQRVAERHSQPYHINAILSGDWDNGSLVKQELIVVEAELIRKREEVIEG